MIPKLSDSSTTLTTPLTAPKTSIMSPKPAALLIGSIVHTRQEWESLSSTLSLKEYPAGNRPDFLSKLKAGEYDDVSIIYRSNDSTAITGPFDAELVKLLPESVRFICHNGAGYDNIDGEPSLLVLLLLLPRRTALQSR